jgi:hypothetical protein
MYIERFLSQIGPKIETIADVLTERNKRSETSQPLDSKRHKPSPAKKEDDDVIVIDHKPHLEAWKAYFRAREFAKNPFVEAPDIKRSVMSFLLKLDQAKKDGKDPLFVLYGGFNASADLKQNVFAALQSEGELNLDKFLSNAKHEADQTRSTIFNKKGFKNDPKHIEDLEAEDWSREDLEKIRDRVEKKVKAFLLADFEEPRQDIDGMFPNLYALVALTFSKGPVSTIEMVPELEEFKEVITKWISSLYEQALCGTPLALSSLDISEMLSIRCVLSRKDFRKNTRPWDFSS